MPADQMANPLMQIVPYLAIFMIFYFLVIKPEKDRQDKKKQKIEALKKNDQVITSGGIHGTIVNVKTTTVMIRIDDNTKIEVEKDAVATVKES